MKQEQSNLFKSKWIFLLSIVIPALMLLHPLFFYENYSCGFKQTHPCTSLAELLSDFAGRVFLVLVGLVFIVGLNILGIVYCFANKYKTAGWILTVVFVGILIYVVSLAQSL